MRATINAYVTFARASPALLELMFATKPRSEVAGLQATAADALSMVPRLIEEGTATGLLASADPDRRALVLAATIRGIVGLVTSDSVRPRRTRSRS